MSIESSKETPEDLWELDVNFRGDAAKQDDEPEGETHKQVKVMGEEDEHWNFMYKGLGELKKMIGHVEVPKGCEYFGVSLYDWAKEQRERYKNTGQRHTWQPKIQCLRSLAFKLEPTKESKPGGAIAATATDQDIENNDNSSVQRVQNTKWEISFRKLVLYVSTHGLVGLTRSCTIDG
jgi:hypothetical protein